MSDQHSKKRMKSLFSFYKRDSDSTQIGAASSNTNVSGTFDPHNSLPVDEMEIIVETPKESPVQTDPGLRDPICTFSVNQQDRIRKEYLQLGSCHPKLKNYPTTFDGRDNRRFQYRWFDIQMMELNNMFTEQSMELLVLTSALDPKNQFKKFDIDMICKRAEKFYPGDFKASEVRALRLQLEYYKCQVVANTDFEDLSSLPQLCRRLVETDLAKLFPLIDMLIRLVLTLPVSTATTERAFSAMKIIKTRLRNKMEDGYLQGCMMLHIENEYVDDIDSEAVIDHFESIGDRKAQFK